MERISASRSWTTNLISTSFPLCAAITGLQLPSVGLQDPVNRDGKQNQHRNEAVGGKKRRVDFAEVVSADQGVFVKQRGAGHDHPGRGNRSQTEAEEHPDKAGEGDQMEQAREA